MIRQKQRREMLTKLGMAQHEELPSPQVKNTVTHLSGQNLRLAPKNGWDSKTPGLHLSPGYREEIAAQLTAGEPLAGAPTRRDPLPEPERECENLPPRRPLKLAPWSSREVQESQRQKIKGIQQEAMAATRKLDAVVTEPHPRKAKTKSPERLPRRPLQEPAGTQRPVKALLPAAQVQPNAAPPRDRSTGRGGVRRQAALPSKPSLPLNPDVKAQAARAEDSAVTTPGAFPEAGRRRLRLRRAQGLDEDQSKSSLSTASRLSSDEAKEVQAGGDRGQRAEKALREASRVLDKASRKNAGPPDLTATMEMSGRPVRRMAVSDIQHAVL